MGGKFARSWSLVKASASVLRQDPELLVFPAISGIALLVLTAAFAIPAMGMGAIDTLAASQGEVPARYYVIGFFFYFLQYFVIFFFNAALVGAVMIRLDGGDPTVGDGLRIASSKLVVILCYAFIAATVGMLLRLLQERLGFVGRIVVGLIGIGWNLATYLVVPVLVDREVGPLEAVKQSAQLLKETWGENVIGQAGIGLAFGIIGVGVVIAGAAFLLLAVKTGNVLLIGIAAIALVAGVALTALVQTALAGVYAAALYRFASNGEGSGALDAGVLRAAFAAK